MNISVFSVSSQINQDLEQLTRQFFKDLEQEQVVLELQDPSRIQTADPCIVYIASGGSEIQFAGLMDRLQAEKIYLLTSGYSNSLAASLEILSYIRQHGKEGEIIHGNPKTCAGKLKAIVGGTQARKRICGMRLGMLGRPSDWLIASRSHEDILRECLGIQVVFISLDQLMEEYEKHTYREDCWTKQLEEMEFDRQELKKALELYGAFDRLVEKYELSGITVRCFDLLERVKSTGCLGLAILNARGIYGGCEGDLPTLVSMVILGEVSHGPVFMCNPSRIDPDQGEMVLAHCTLPLNMPYSMELKTHFESDMGVAVAGKIPEGEITVFKISGDLKEYYMDRGRILENMQDPTLCRSQIRIQLPSYDYFFERPISNHHVICCGDHTQALKYFLNFLTPPDSSSASGRFGTGKKRSGN